jgi:hypothetical protein
MPRVAAVVFDLRVLMEYLYVTTNRNVLDSWTRSIEQN